MLKRFQNENNQIYNERRIPSRSFFLNEKSGAVLAMYTGKRTELEPFNIADNIRIAISGDQFGGISTARKSS